MSPGEGSSSSSANRDQGMSPAVGSGRHARKGGSSSSSSPSKEDVKRERDGLKRKVGDLEKEVSQKDEKIEVQRQGIAALILQNKHLRELVPTEEEQDALELLYSVLHQMVPSQCAHQNAYRNQKPTPCLFRQ